MIGDAADEREPQDQELVRDVTVEEVDLVARDVEVQRLHRGYGVQRAQIALDHERALARFLAARIVEAPIHGVGHRAREQLLDGIEAGAAP